MRAPLTLLGLAMLLSISCNRDVTPGAAEPTRSTISQAPDLAQPDLARLRALLTPHASHRFDLSAQTRGCPDSTLGEYLETLSSQTAPDPQSPNEVRRLTGSCTDFPPTTSLTLVDPPADPAYWFCRIDAFVSDTSGESPWHYELRLRVNRDDQGIDLDHLGCPGSS